jgi:hypothetical protein
MWVVVSDHVRRRLTGDQSGPDTCEGEAALDGETQSPLLLCGHRLLRDAPSDPLG